MGFGVWGLGFRVQGSGFRVTHRQASKIMSIKKNTGDQKTQEDQRKSLLVLWSPGPLVPVGPLVLWSFGPLVLWSCGHPLVCPFVRSGPRVLWSPVPLVLVGPLLLCQI